MGESGLLDDCPSKTPARRDDLLLLDRNFSDFHNVNATVNEGGSFYIRMSTKTTNFAQQVVADEWMDFFTKWAASKKDQETSKTNAPYKYG